MAIITPLPFIFGCRGVWRRGTVHDIMTFSPRDYYLFIAQTKNNHHTNMAGCHIVMHRPSRSFVSFFALPIVGLVIIPTPLQAGQISLDPVKLIPVG